DGYSLMAFHGNLNVEMEGLEAGQWARDITKAKNGQWVFRDRNAELKIGDTIYFWTYVIKNGLGYRQDNGEWTVTGYVDEEGKEIDTNKLPPPTEAPTQRPGPGPQTPRPTQAPSCQTSQTAVMGLNGVCKGSLIFSEEFNRNNLKELTNWEAESKFPEEPDYPFNVYMTEGTMKFEDSSLVISPILLEDYKYEGFIHECTGAVDTSECKRRADGAYILPPVMTGKVTTKHKFSFKFGRVEIRAKLPAGSWLVPELNLEPLENVYGTRRYESGLIRVAFAKGNDVYAKKLYGGPVLSDTDPYRTLRYFYADGLQLLVDGEQYGVVSPDEGFHTSARENAVPHAANWLKGSVMAPLDQMFYLSLGLRVGGIHDFQDENDKPWRNKGNKATVSFYNAKDSWFPTWYDSNLKVDYVRVYAL
ncbi:Beta-1,3-glucan recognition protein 3, partial [Operophtera brumata]